jgi:hypothetical protein
VPTDRVSQRSEDQKRVEELQQASAFLREHGAPAQLADAVDFVLTEEGRKFIGRLHWKKTDQANPNLAMEIPETLRNDIKAAAAVAGANLEAEAQRALEEFLAGRFTPAQSAREARGEAPKKVNLNVRVNAELRRRAEVMANDLLAQDEMTWAPKVSNIIVSWFVDRLEEDFRNPARKPAKQ